MNRISAWYTSEGGAPFKLDPQPDLGFTPQDTLAQEGGQVIQVAPEITYQSILGIGSSLEEASVYHLARMSQETRTRVLGDLVDSGQGIGWNLFRICLGSSDFTGQPYYSYDDMPAGESDPQLERFSIQKDIDSHILAP